MDETVRESASSCFFCSVSMQAKVVSVTEEQGTFEAPPKLQDIIILVTKYSRTQKQVENKSALNSVLYETFCSKLTHLSAEPGAPKLLHPSTPAPQHPPPKHPP